MGITRKLIEKYSQGKVLKRKIISNGFTLPIYVSLDARLAYFKGKRTVCLERLG